MLIIKMREGENIERALKKFKRKCNQTKLVKKLREQQVYRKPGEVRRELKQKAVYRERLLGELEDY